MEKYSTDVLGVGYDGPIFIPHGWRGRQVFVAFGKAGFF
jgi:hypothetical protein